MLEHTLNQRGVIQNRARKQQIADMSGLRYEKITPTDLDGFMDFGNRLFVFIEGKFVATPVLYGQQLAIDRLCDATNNPPSRYSFAIIADHFHPCDEDIDFANMTVRTIRQNGRWKEPLQKGLTVRAAIDRMVAYTENRQGKMLVRLADCFYGAPEDAHQAYLLKKRQLHAGCTI